MKFIKRLFSCIDKNDNDDILLSNDYRPLNGNHHKCHYRTLCNFRNCDTLIYVNKKNSGPLLCRKHLPEYYYNHEYDRLVKFINVMSDKENNSILQNINTPKGLKAMKNMFQLSY